jgi:hypothetical protein
LQQEQKVKIELYGKLAFLQTTTDPNRAFRLRSPWSISDSTRTRAFENY